MRSRLLLGVLIAAGIVAAIGDDDHSSRDSYLSKAIRSRHLHDRRSVLSRRGTGKKISKLSNPKPLPEVSSTIRDHQPVPVPGPLELQRYKYKDGVLKPATEVIGSSRNSSRKDGSGPDMGHIGSSRERKPVRELLKEIPKGQNTMNPTLESDMNLRPTSKPARATVSTDGSAFMMKGDKDVTWTSMVTQGRKVTGYAAHQDMAFAGGQNSTPSQSLTAEAKGPLVRALIDTRGGGRATIGMTQQNQRIIGNVGPGVQISLAERGSEDKKEDRWMRVKVTGKGGTRVQAERIER